MHRFLRLLTAVVAGILFLLIAGAVWDPALIKRHQIESIGLILAALWAVTLVMDRPGDALQGERRHPWLVPAVVAGGIVLFWHAVLVGRLSDDYVIETWAESGRFLGIGSPFARPVVVGLWTVALGLGGGSAVLHVINVAVHIGNTILIAALLRQLRASSISSAVAAIVFLVWPTQVEAVTWSSGMFDVLMTTFVLMSLLLTAPGAGVRTLLAGAASALVALLCKETAVAVPLLWIVCYGSLRERSIKAATPLLLLVAPTAVYFIWRAWLRLPLSGATHLSRYIIKELASRTIAGLALPFSADTLARHPWIAVLAAAAVLGLGVALTHHESEGPRMAARGLAWTLVAAAPTIGFLFIGRDLEGSRYLYLPCVGWAMFVGVGLAQVLRFGSGVSLAAIWGALMAVAIMQQQVLIADWVRAGSERDRIVSQAARVAAATGCGHVRANGLPARFRGAQLFNAGFAEALAHARGPSGGLVDCHLRWTGETFVPEP